jgi:signal transduction histidine kinase
MKNRVYVLVLPFLLLALTYGCGGNKENTEKNLVPFTEDSLKIVGIFQRALTSATPDIQIDSALALVRQSSNSYQSADLFLLQKATFNLRRGNFEGAMALAKQGIQLNEKFTSKNKAKFYNVQGHVFSYQRNNTEAIESFKKALAIFESNQDSLNIAYINNNIANIFFSLTDYSTAYKHSRASFDFIQHYPQDPYYVSIMSVLAISEAFIGKKEDALKHAEKALSLTENTPNIVPYVLSLYALGDIAVSEDSLAKAETYYKKSLAICETYKIIPYALINKTALLNVSEKSGKYREAIEYGNWALELSQLTQNENIQLSIHKNLSKAYKALNDNANALSHLSTAYQLKEEISSKENKSIIHDLLIQYESEKKDKEISENKIKLLEDEAVIQRGRFLIILLSLGFVVIAIIVYLFIKNRKQALLRIEKEKENEVMKASLIGEQNERLRLSRELHDGIASEILGLKIKGQEKNVESAWLESLTSIHQEVRRISHNLSPFKVEQFGLTEALKIFTIENSTPQCSIHFYSNSEEKLSTPLSQVIYRCAQELIQNALKHAQAADIDVQLFIEKDIRLSIEDNGVGMNNETLEHIIIKIKSQWAATGMIEEMHGESAVNSGTTYNLIFKK